METIPELLKTSATVQGKTIVIKYGGNALNNLNDRNQSQPAFQEIALLYSLGFKVILVHGGGPQINQMLARLQIESKHIDGLRITDQDTVDVAEMVLCGSINKLLVSFLQRLKVNAIGLSGKDLDLFSVKAKSGLSVDLGYFGEVDTINIAQFDYLLSQPFIPVIAPIGLDASGSTFMLDADHLASQIASALKADKLFILTNVSGVMKAMGNSETMISTLSCHDADQLVKDGQVTHGMIPKLQSCIEAARQGVRQVHIFNGQTPNALLTNADGTEVIGTVLC